MLNILQLQNLQCHPKENCHYNNSIFFFHNNTFKLCLIKDKYTLILLSRDYCKTNETNQ